MVPPMGTALASAVKTISSALHQSVRSLRAAISGWREQLRIVIRRRRRRPSQHPDNCSTKRASRVGRKATPHYCRAARIPSRSVCASCRSIQYHVHWPRACQLKLLPSGKPSFRRANHGVQYELQRWCGLLVSRMVASARRKEPSSPGFKAARCFFGPSDRSAPCKPCDGLRTARPLATAKRKICPQI